MAAMNHRRGFGLMLAVLLVLGSVTTADAAAAAWTLPRVFREQQRRNSPPPSSSSTIAWANAGSGVWRNSTAWTPNRVPCASDAVALPLRAPTTTIVLSQSQAVRSISFSTRTGIVFRRTGGGGSVGLRLLPDSKANDICPRITNITITPVAPELLVVRWSPTQRSGVYTIRVTDNTTTYQTTQTVRAGDDHSASRSEAWLVWRGLLPVQATVSAILPDVGAGPEGTGTLSQSTPFVVWRGQTGEWPVAADWSTGASPCPQANVLVPSPARLTLPRPAAAVRSITLRGSGAGLVIPRDGGVRLVSQARATLAVECSRFATTPSPGNSPASEGNSLTIVIAAVIAAAVVILVLLLIAWRSRKRNSRQLPAERIYGNPTYEDVPLHLLPVTEAAPIAGIPPSVVDWAVDPARITLSGVLGMGCYGPVRRGLLIDPRAPAGRQRQPVAVRLLNRDAPPQDVDLFDSEVKLMQSLGRSPAHVLGLTGVAMRTWPRLVLLPFCLRGRLSHVLRDARATQTMPQALAPRELVIMCSHVAAGMRFLAQRHVVHCNLQTATILVAADGSCLVSDYARSVTRRTVLPRPWFAPETLRARIFSTKTDTWAFGVLVWEVVTLGASPYPMVDALQLSELLHGGYRMPRPTLCTPDMYRVMRACWELDAANRPSFDALHGMLTHAAAGAETTPPAGGQTYLDFNQDDAQVWGPAQDVQAWDEGAYELGGADAWNEATYDVSTAALPPGYLIVADENAEPLPTDATGATDASDAAAGGATATSAAAGVVGSGQQHSYTVLELGAPRAPTAPPRMQPEEVAAELASVETALQDVMMRVRSLYGRHFPELAEIVPDGAAYIRCVAVLGRCIGSSTSEPVNPAALRGVVASGVALRIAGAAQASIGADISEADMDVIRAWCNKGAAIDARRTILMQQQQSRVAERVGYVEPSVSYGGAGDGATYADATSPPSEGSGGYAVPDVDKLLDAGEYAEATVVARAASSHYAQPVVVHAAAGGTPYAVAHSVTDASTDETAGQYAVAQVTTSASEDDAGLYAEATPTVMRLGGAPYAEMHVRTGALGGVAYAEAHDATAATNVPEAGRVVMAAPGYDIQRLELNAGYAEATDGPTVVGAPGYEVPRLEVNPGYAEAVVAGGPEEQEYAMVSDVVRTHGFLDEHEL